MARRYWLMKSEPDAYSLTDLKNEKDGTACGDGVRNYQARNLMRDEMKVGDGVLFYHSNCKPPGVVGVAEVVKEGYVDDTAFDASEKYYDPKSDPENPRWMMVDVKYISTLKSYVSLETLKNTPGLEEMKTIQKGQRLSVQPVTEGEWNIVLGLGDD